MNDWLIDLVNELMNEYSGVDAANMLSPLTCDAEDTSHYTTPGQTMSPCWTMGDAATGGISKLNGHRARFGFDLGFYAIEGEVPT